MSLWLPLPLFLWLQSHEMVVRWEESKKWQKMVERLKGRLKDKEQEIEKLTKASELLKHGLERYQQLHYF